MKTKVAEFESKFGMTQAFGCVDGTHIPIRRPYIDSQDYFNYKQYFSVNVQAVCDAQEKFMDVDCRWPGCVYDAKVFANSQINIALKSGNLPGTFNNLLPGYDKIPNYLIGDPAYPLTPFCMKEYQSCKTNSEVLFNISSQPNRMCIWPLKSTLVYSNQENGFEIGNIPIVVMACFVLHNFCKWHNDTIDQEAARAQMEWNCSEDNTHKNIPDPIYSCTTGEGELVRQTLTGYVQINIPDR